MLLLQSSYDLPPLEVQPFNPLDQGTFGTGLSVPNPLPFIKLPSAQELIQVPAQLHASLQTDCESLDRALGICGMSLHLCTSCFMSDGIRSLDKVPCCTLPQAEEAASNPKLPVVSMATPYLPLAQPGALASVAPQVHAGLAQLPESFVHPSLPAATEWAAKLSEFLVEKGLWPGQTRHQRRPEAYWRIRGIHVPGLTEPQEIAVRLACCLRESEVCDQSGMNQEVFGKAADF